MANLNEWTRAAALFAVCGTLPALVTAGAGHEGFSRVSLELPGIPAAMIPADVDGDGIEDLVVVVVYTDWGDKATFDETTFDGVEGMVEVMSVVTSLIDHRELRVYPGLAGEAGYGEPLPPLELDVSIHALAAGHPAAPLVAVTDEGIAAILYLPQAPDAPLVIEPLVAHASLYTGSARFYSDVDFLVDLDGDGIQDALLPTETGWAAFAGTDSGFDTRPRPIAAPLARDPAKEPEAGGEDEEAREDVEPRRRRRPAVRNLTIRDLTGDGWPEIAMVATDGGQGAFVYENLGGLRFAEPVEYGEPEVDDNSPQEKLVYFGSLALGGPAWAVARTEVERWADPTASQEIEQAKRPLFRYALHTIGHDLSLGPPERHFEAIGYTFEGNEEGEPDADADDDEDQVEIRLPSGFQDLDGDGRDDLVSISLDFSIVPLIARALVIRSIKLTLDFHVSCQQADGSFAEVPGLDLSGKFKFNFRKNVLRHLSQFAGDFDADGRADFVQLGRGRRITIHHGQPGCRYPSEPSGEIVLEHKPQHLGLVRILDLNADERSDLYVVHPLTKPEPGRPTPVRVDLYRSAARGQLPSHELTTSTSR